MSSMPPGGPYGAPQQNPYGGQPTAPYGAGQPTAPYAAPPQPGYGAPSGAPGYAAPPTPPQNDTVYGPMNLPNDDNINPYAFSVALNGTWFMQKGKMIAHYGQIRFEALGAAQSLSSMIAARFSSPLYVQDWVVATGQGHLLLGDRGYDINSYDLDNGNLTIRAANLLAFQTQLSLKQSIVPGFVTLLGTGKFLASSNGPVMFIEPPVRVDPQALVGWADCPSPSHHYDAAWMQNFMGAAQAFFGRESGEERQFDFTGAGTVLLQSSEAMQADASTLRLVQSQAETLSVDQMGWLGQHLTSRASAQQQH